MYLIFKKMIYVCLSFLVVSCNSNSTSTESGDPSTTDPNAVTAVTGVNKPESLQQVGSKPANQISNALKYQCRLPQGIKSTECETVLTLAKSSSSVYDYLDLANEAYKNAYYAANIDIIAIAKSILKSQSQEEICRLSIQSLKALDSVRTNFRDPYGYLEDVYERFLRASQATKAESCP